MEDVESRPSPPPSVHVVHLKDLPSSSLYAGADRRSEEVNPDSGHDIREG